MTSCDLPHLSWQTWQTSENSTSSATTTQEHLKTSCEEEIFCDKITASNTEEETQDEVLKREIVIGDVAESYHEMETYIDQSWVKTGKEEGKGFRCSEGKEREEHVKIDKNEFSEEMFPHGPQNEIEERVHNPAPPNIVVTSPIKNYDQNETHLLSQTYKCNPKMEYEKAERNTPNCQTDDSIKCTNINKESTEEYGINDQNENYVDLNPNPKNSELSNISAKLLLLDMSQQFEDHSSSSDSVLAGSPVSDGETPDTSTYINLLQDDGICALGAGSSPRCSPGNLTPLDPISEHDESEDEKVKDWKTNRKISLPKHFQSNFSLSTIPVDEETAQAQSNEDDAQNPSNGKTDMAFDSTCVDHAAENTKKRRQRKKGRVTKEPLSPVFLNEGVRTFSNPVSYLGGPNISYEEEEGEEGKGRKRNDSLVSTTSID